ncbi:MAG: polysaccharide deacetylase family protein [Ignavibacteriaceae bacterium]
MANFPQDPINFYDYLQRKEELDSWNDHLGNFEFFTSKLFWDSYIFNPIVDYKLNEMNPGFNEKIKWPNRHDYAVALTHDVDMLSPFARIEHWRRIKINYTNWDTITKIKNILGLRHSAQSIDIFSPWIEVEKKYSFNSTFFVMPYEINKRDIMDNTYKINDRTYIKNRKIIFSKFLKEVHNNGWEIGIHGSIHAATDLEEFVLQKKQLEKELGFKIFSNRFHNLSFNRRETPPILDRAGILCDSTLGSNRLAGFRTGTTYPHKLELFSGNNESSFLEIPMNIMDSAILRFDNLGFNENIGFEFCKRIIDRVRSFRGVVTLNWHPHVIQFPSWWNLYNRLLEYIYDTNGWGTNCASLIDWWTAQGLDKILDSHFKKLK